MIEKNYDEHEAFDYIKVNMVNSGLYSDMNGEFLEKFIQGAMESDEKYMKEAGIFSDENAPHPLDEEVIYDEEDAFNFILQDMRQNNEYRNIKDQELEDMIDDYLAYNIQYMEDIGIIS
ncbi:hypothetical protein [Xylanivirga thermophila]|uniref:hypothetical protein n=1 Tax=Xylanivirga thermophila TaxID=2496273 RepID=UPI00101CF088|nr:hypothetical protein [Xylanivirga thermophila]